MGQIIRKLIADMVHLLPMRYCRMKNPDHRNLEKAVRLGNIDLILTTGGTVWRREM
jgi:hypothetical protein